MAFERLREDEWIEKTVQIRRVAKVVAGGRRFNFSVLVVVGDGKGRVGVGLGKARQVPDAVRKAVADAKKNIIEVPIINDTIPHEVIGHFKASKVLLKPASPGTGVIAGSTVRAVVEAAGIKNILTKSLGSNNPQNLVKAVIDGFLQLESPEYVAKKRGKKVEEILGE